MAEEEPKIRIGDREELIYMLSEAAEIEHNVMCGYLYGIWSLKRDEADGLTAEQCGLIAQWRDHMTAVAVEEMTHLTLVGNLLCAIGAPAHLSRSNFPIPAADHPGTVDLELYGFSPELVEHAIYLERPEGVDLADAPEFEHLDNYHREAPKGRVMPNAQDYASIGHLYRGIYHGMERLTQKLGEEALFCGDVADQISPADAPLPGLSVVTNLATAHQAIETIVEQGEGAPDHSEDSHYQRFLNLRASFQAATENYPGFEPAFPVARNPVPAQPANPAGTIWVTDPEACLVLDFANSVYNQMLRFLAQAFGRDDTKGHNKRLFVTLAREMMSVLTPLCNHLASLPAGPEHPGVNAGMSFTMVRDITRLPAGSGEMRVMRERMDELAAQARKLFAPDHRLGSISDALSGMADRIDAPSDRATPQKAPPAPPAPQAGKPKKTNKAIVGHAEGKDMHLSFDTGRCIHARFCVLGAPKVFLSGVKGQWLFPDKMDTEALRAVCHNCPSGAVQYTPKGGTQAEPAPPVNIVKLRENGPYAFRAPMRVDGENVGFRATLCRCGASGNKPFCDGSHVKAGFSASGEPDTRPSEPLAVRDGPLDIRPQKNGPLQVSGNLEICSGTGRNIDRVTGARLCRCGGSKTKPFCDNTHLKIGFKSD